MEPDIENSRQIALQFSKRNGILPVIVQEHSTNEVLMLGYSNEEAFNRTINTQKATFYSTSKDKIWVKGETSGDYLQVEEVFIDCDQDALLYKVTLLGKGVCHTKNSRKETRKSCFYRKAENNVLNFVKGEE